jgi:2-methylcitrate dehydratase PrpD
MASAELPPTAIHDAKRCLIDWFAATIPGGLVPPATLLADALLDDEAGHAMLFPSGRAASIRTAALINGAAAHVLEFDDIFRDAIYHPGAPVIAAALATAQSRGLAGDALIRAMVAGYEVSGRIGAAMLPAHYQFWHPTGTVGCFGAAAAVSLLLGLDGDRTAHALANAATLAAGLQQAFRSDSMGKPLHAGRAAETGALTALAAAQGVTGAEGMLDGARGFGNAMGRDVDWDGAVAGLGDDTVITRMTQKNHACCGHIFAALDSVLALRGEHGLTPADVKRISVGTYATALEVAGNPEPATVFEAKFSIAYCIAVALSTGRVRMAAFAPELLDDAGLRRLMGRVALHVDADADAKAPGRRAATVTIETHDGRKLRHRSDTRKGDPESPLSDDELEEKYTELTVPVIGEDAAGLLLETLWRMDELDDLAVLSVACRQPRAA